MIFILSNVLTLDMHTYTITANRICFVLGCFLFRLEASEWKKIGREKTEKKDTRSGFYNKIDELWAFFFLLLQRK